MKFKKILALLAAVLTMFVCSICAVADDALIDDSEILIVGAKPITADEAKRAFSIAVDTEVSQLSGMYQFVEDTTTDVVIVYVNEPNSTTMVDVIFYANNGDICGVSGWAVTPALMLEYFVDIIASGVKGIFDLGGLGFSFLMGNALLAFFVCVSFGFTSFLLFRSAFKSAKKI